MVVEWFAHRFLLPHTFASRGGTLKCYARLVPNCGEPGAGLTYSCDGNAKQLTIAIQKKHAIAIVMLIINAEAAASGANGVAGRPIFPIFRK
eukprot:4463803-Amphidinium_carterae.1